jgi:hypothetical protein
MEWDMNALRSISARLHTLELTVGRAYEQCARGGSSPDELVKSKRALMDLLDTVSGALDVAYRRRARGELTAEEKQFWLPPIEALRTLMRRALGSLPTSWGEQLDQAKTRVRQSSAVVAESLGGP